MDNEYNHTTAPTAAPVPGLPNPTAGGRPLLPSAAYPAAVHRVAVSLGFYVALASLVIAVPLCMFVETLRQYWLYAIAGSMIVGVLTTAIYGARWSLSLANMQGFSRNDLVALGSHLPRQSAPSIGAADRLRLASFQVLALHYQTGSEATRPECERLGITQTDWNTVNKINIALGLKSERSWSEQNYETALNAWHNRVRIDPNRSIWVRPSATVQSWQRVTV